METTLQIFDIKERDIDEIAPPSFPTPSAPSAGGFPAHKKRVSAFKQKRQAKSATASPAPATTLPPPKGPSQDGASGQEGAALDERRGIDEENKAVIASMSADEIAEAQKELYAGLDPKFIQMLLRRANLDEPTGPSPFDMTPAETSPSSGTPAPTKPLKAAVEDAPEDADPTTEPEPPVAAPKEAASASAVVEATAAPKKPTDTKPKKTVTFDEDAPPASPPPTLFPATNVYRRPKPGFEPKPSITPKTSSNDHPPRHGTHWPQPPQVPDLDPADPNFLEALQSKYFPNLPADPSKLAWMAPVPTADSPADRESPYYPGQSSLPVSALRFDFRGALLPPRVSRAIPVSRGLHHHGEAPEAAGYTIPELARLARSAVPAQRCLAYQTLGRMLYRLGRGDWGRGEGGRAGEEDDLAFALWRCFRDGRVLESLEEEAARPEGTGHLSCRAYAIEALWLFEKGGWKERWRGL